MPLKLSIQIALHNRADFIKECVLSALHCGYDNAEIIILDDASSDNSGEIVKTLMQGYPGRIRYIRSDEELGCAKSRAAMVNSSDAEYVLILDDDDILLPFDIAGNLACMDRNKDIAVSYGKLFLIDAAGTPLHSVFGWPYSTMLLAYNNPVMHPGAIIRRSDILDAGNYEAIAPGPNAVASDLLLWFRIALQKGFRFSNEFLVLYRRHAGQLTSNAGDYLNAANMIHKRIIDANKEIYERILGGNISVAPAEQKTVLLLLAIMSRYMPQDAPQRLRMLDAAETLAPHDYGVNAVKFEYYFALADYGAALQEAFKILENTQPDAYIRILGYEKLLKVCRQTGADSGEVEKQLTKHKGEYAAIPVAISKYCSKR